jgi:glycosyltransferase involved in cell wall biosynthesis
MHTSHLAQLILAWLVALAWLYKFAEAAVGLPAVPNLATAEDPPDTPRLPRLAVIVPARNEARNVAACLHSLLQQDYPGLLIFAVDDRSSDATGAIIDTLAAQNPTRLQAIHITDLPAGWLGKTHAMATTATRVIAEGDLQGGPPDYLLFTDGDVVFHPKILRRAVAQAESAHSAHQVVLPTTVVRSHGEGMLLGYLQVMSYWGVRTWRVRDPRSRDSLGVGAFNLIRVSAYRRIGGFDAMPMEIVEDLELGRRVKHAGLGQGVATAPGMVNVHWAAGWIGIVRGMTKNIFAVFGFRTWLLLAASVGLALMSIAPAVLLALPGARLPAALALAAVLGLSALSSRTSRIPLAYAVLFPLAGALVFYSMLRSMAVTLLHGGVTWRGTFYPLDDLRKRTHFGG